MAKIKVQKSQLYYVEIEGATVNPVTCPKTLTLGTDTEADIDTTCLDDEEDNSEPGQVTPGEGALGIDLDDENASHLAMIALSNSKPRKKVMWYLGSSNSTDAPTITDDVVTLPTTRTWWSWEGYLKKGEPTFEKGQLVGYNFPMKRTSSIAIKVRTIPSP